MSQQLPKAPPAGGSAASGGAIGNPDAPGVNPVVSGGNGAGGGPGEREVGVVGIVLLTTYLVLFTLFLVYALIVV